MPTEHYQMKTFKPLPQRWDRDYFESLGLHHLRVTIRYPGNPPGNRRTA